MKLVSENDVLSHYGIDGQKWGVRNGPPYPLKDNDTSKYSTKEINDMINRYNAEKTYAKIFEESNHPIKTKVKNVLQNKVVDGIVLASLVVVGQEWLRSVLPHPN